MMLGVLVLASLFVQPGVNAAPPVQGRALFAAEDGGLSHGLGLSEPISLDQFFPEVTKEDRAFLRALRPKFDRVTAAQRLKGKGKLEEALEAARIVVRDVQDFGPAIDAYVDIANAAKQLDDAAAWFEARSQRLPESWTGWYGVAKVREARKDLQGALEAGSRAIEAGCDFWGCYAAVASAYEGLEQLDAGEEYFRALATGATQGSTREGLAWWGVGSLRFGDIAHRAESVEMLERALSKLRPGRGWEICQRDLEKIRERLWAVETAMIPDWYKALAIVQEEGDRGNEGILLRQLGVTCPNRCDARVQTRYVERSLTLLEELGLSLEVAWTLFDLGSYVWTNGDSRQALSYYERSLAMSRDLGNTPLQGLNLLALGSTYHSSGQTQRAIAYLEQSLEQLQQVRDPDYGGLALRVLAAAYLEMGDAQRAIEHARRALAIHRSSGSRGAELGDLTTLGAIFHRFGEDQLAVENYRQALAFFPPGEGGPQLAKLLAALGALSLDSGAEQQGIDHIQEALTIDRRIADRWLEAAHTGTLGEGYFRLGRLKEAADAFQQALELHRALGARSSEGVILGQLAKVRCALGDTQQGIAELQQSAALLEELEARDAARDVAVALSRAYAMRGNRNAALTQAQHALELLDRLTSVIEDPDLEASYFARSTSPQALMVRLLTSELPGSPAPPLTLEVEAHAFALGEEARARSFHRRVQLAKLDLTRDAPPGPLARFENAGYLLNQARGFLGDQRASSMERAVLDAWLGEQLASALETEARMQMPLSDEATRLKRQWDALKAGTLESDARAALLKAMFRARERDYLEAERALREASPVYRQVVRPRLASLPEIQAVLDERTALLAYLLGEDESFAWVITREVVQLLHLPPEREITEQVELLRASLSRPESPLRELDERALSLYRLLVGPAARWLPADAHLVIIPDGSLGQLPFEALLTRPRQPGDRSRAWLGVEHTIAYSPSATLWRNTHPQETSSRIDGPLLLVGDPVYHEDTCDLGTRVAVARGPDTRAGLLNETWQRLCYAGEEITRIKRARRRGLRQRGDDVYLLAARASEGAFRAQDLSRFSILHFSSHAVAWDDIPLRSAIVLSQQQDLAKDDDAATPGDTPPTAKDDADGYLELREINLLHLRAELAVLSACETAEGRQRKGEGVESLARGFLMAGAKRVVASEWAVADRSTAQFMGRFYRELRRTTVEEALRRTRRAFILGEEGGNADGIARASRGRLGHPYYWAPFVLIEGASEVQGPSGAR